MSHSFSAGLVSLVLALLAAPLSAHAEDVGPGLAEEATAVESGHFSVSVGAHVGDDSGSLTARAQMRAALAFNVAGPLAVGGFAQVLLADGAMEQPGFGGGVLLTLRPELPLLGFVPHLEVNGARLQLPSGAQGLLDAWSIGIGGGIGYAIASDIAIEARVQHAWYFGLPSSTSLSDRAWTVGAALTIDLP